MYVAGTGHVGIARLLLDHDTDPDLKTKTGYAHDVDGRGFGQTG